MEESIGEYLYKKIMNSYHHLSLEDHGLNPLVLPEDLVPIELISREGFAIIHSNTKISECDDLLDIIVDINQQKKYSGYDFIPIIDYTHHIAGIHLNLHLALKEFEGTHYDYFDRALFFSKNPGDIIHYGCKRNEAIYTIPWYSISIKTIKLLERYQGIDKNYLDKFN